MDKNLPEGGLIAAAALVADGVSFAEIFRLDDDIGQIKSLSIADVVTADINEVNGIVLQNFENNSVGITYRKRIIIFEVAL